MNNKYEEETEEEREARQEVEWREKYCTPTTCKVCGYCKNCEECVCDDAEALKYRLYELKIGDDEIKNTHGWNWNCDSCGERNSEKDFFGWMRKEKGITYQCCRRCDEDYDEHREGVAQGWYTGLFLSLPYEVRKE